MGTTLTTQNEAWDAPSGAQAAARHLALVIGWSRSEPARLGQVALVPDDGDYVLGRGTSGPGQRLQFAEQRAGSWQPGGAIGCATISRDQIHLRAEGSRLHFKRSGKAPLFMNGAAHDEGVLRAGTFLRVGTSLVLICVERPAQFPAIKGTTLDRFGAFGTGGDMGWVGESECSWRLRQQAVLVSQSARPLLLTGPRGAGKRRLASMVHDLSGRADGPFRAASAGTLRAGVAQAPDVATATLGKLLKEAEGGTLYIADYEDLQPDVQAILLGRLGDARDDDSVRLIVGAAADDASDFTERFQLQLTVPGLSERLEDIPLLARALAARAADENDTLTQRFFEALPSGPAVRLNHALVEALLVTNYAYNTEELDALLWTSLITSEGERLQCTPEVTRRLSVEARNTSLDAPGRTEFITAVRHALRNYHRANELLKSPLLRSRLVAQASESPGVSVLRETLASECEAGTLTEQQRKLLTATYLRPSGKQLRVASDLGLAYSTYRRHLSEAADAIGVALWEKEVAS